MAYVKTNWVDNTTPIDENNLNKIESGIKNNDINIGEENYDNTKTYEVGDIVRYNEKIYKCITAITTAENFDISKWKQTNIVEIVQSEKSKIYELIEALSTPIVGEGENITLNDTAEKRFEKFDIEGNSEQEATPSPDYPSEVKSCGDNGSINEVICNKNLFNVGENSYSKMGLNITLDKSRIKINGTTTGNYYILTKDDINAIYLGKFKKGTYYMTRQQFSGFTKKGNGFALQIRKDVWNGTVVASYGMETTLQQKKVILDEDVDLYLNMWANKDDIYNNVEFLFSIYSDTDINHVQHQEQSYTIPTQQPMRAIGNVRDKFILKENGKWYEHHPVIRKIFDGTENWTFNESSINPFGVVLSGVTNLTDSQSNAPNCISNYFTTVAWSETASGGKFYESEFLMTSLTDNNLRIRNKNYSTLDDFKSWLAEQYANGTPVYVDYILETPLDIECTSEQTEILNQMYIKAKTYKGITHIYSNDAVSPNCYVEAVKDLTTLIQ